MRNTVYNLDVKTTNVPRQWFSFLCAYTLFFLMTVLFRLFPRRDVRAGPVFTLGGFSVGHRGAVVGLLMGP